MGAARTLIVFPASLHGGRWASGPRVKAGLVSLYTVLRHHGVEVSVLDLENEIGNPNASDRDTFSSSVERRLAGLDPELVVISCSSSLQYTASLAVAEVFRDVFPDVPIGAVGFHVAVRPHEFTYEGTPFDWVVAGESEPAVVELAERTAKDGRPAACSLVEGPPLGLGADTVPDVAGYPYIRPGLSVLHTSLSRGCPFPLAACAVSPGAPTWRAYAPDLVPEIVARHAEHLPGRVEILDPAFGLEAGWRAAALQALDLKGERRDVALTLGVRPETFTRADVDLAYRADVRLRMEVGTLSTDLLERTGAVPHPVRYVEHALDLLRYVNAKGILTDVELVFNRPGETRASAAETVDALRGLIDELPTTTLRLVAAAWVYVPFADPDTDLLLPRERFGTRILHPEWWREGISSERAAKAVVASHDLADLEAGDESYWRPDFERVLEAATAKLTGAARRGIRSHESVGSASTGVPHGFWVASRWS